MTKAFAGLAWLPFLCACATVASVPPDAAKDLAPGGKLRAAINFGNPVLAQKDPATGEPRGVSVDLARELGRRLGVPDAAPYALNARRSCARARPRRRRSSSS
jgi:polar amino acid transport system substrate-binding protein